MKKVIKGKKLLNYIDKAITILSDAVKTTLGPNGTNVIINDSKFSPYITNDGVTIANAMENDNKIINAILTIIKEAALKTNDLVGDGTTTTILLLESIYKNSIVFMKNQQNALKFKTKLYESVTNIIQKIESYSKTPTTSDLKKIASIAANDENIGILITDFYLQLNQSNNIKLEENIYSSKDYVEKLQGYFLENSLASSYFLQKSNYDIKNLQIILFNKEINYFTEIEQVIYEAVKINQNLLIIADSFANDVINEVIALNYENTTKIILINNPEYGIRKLDILEDLKIISNAIQSEDYWKGNIKEFKITDSLIYLIYNSNNKILKYISQLKITLQKEKDEYNYNYLNDRISKLEDIYGIIYVGGITSIERREKKMRFTDAICALKATKQGVVPGSGLILYQISEEIKKETLADKAIAKSLKAPLVQILKNSNVNSSKIINYIKKNNYQILYNSKAKTFESIYNSNVLDNTSVLVNALSNAVSIASLLLTTSHLVINETTNNINIDSIKDNI